MVVSGLPNIVGGGVVGDCGDAESKVMMVTSDDSEDGGEESMMIVDDSATTSTTSSASLVKSGRMVTTRSQESPSLQPPSASSSRLDSGKTVDSAALTEGDSGAILSNGAHAEVDKDHCEDDDDCSAPYYFLPLRSDLDLHTAILEAIALEPKYQPALSLPLTSRVRTVGANCLVLML